VPTATIDRARAEKKIKTLFGWLFFRRVSLPLALVLARTPVTPAQITAAGLGFGLAGAALLGTGRYVWLVVGAVFAVVAKLLDAVDGEVARAKHLDTPAGYVVDGLVDRVRDAAVIVGLGVGSYRMGHPAAVWWTLGAVAGYLGFFYVSAASPSHWREARSTADIDDKHMFRVGGRLRLGAGDTLAVITMLGAALDHPLWTVIAVAAVSPVAIGMKVRRLFLNRPWERDEEYATPRV
jgi:phosphatidylglycerophosphate synthase